MQAKRLRIYLGESDRLEGRPAFEQLVHEAMTRGLAGATVFRAVIGFGAHRAIHSGKLLPLAENLPMVVEIIDAPERVDEFAEFVAKALPKGAFTLETVEWRQFSER